MRSTAFIICLLCLLNSLFAQDNRKGKVTREKFAAPSIQGNRGGEDPMRSVTVYLPPGYETSSQRYPVTYFLHGFMLSDTLVFQFNRLNELMDSAILGGHLRPMILVVPNSNTNFGGSFYTNSALTGNWADFIAKDVVNLVDKNYRTIAERNSRGLAGHSMGGNGAIKIGMLYPAVFGAVYALSPAALDDSLFFSVQDPIFKEMGAFRNDYDGNQLMGGLMRGDPAAIKKFRIKVMAALARTWSPLDEKTFIAAKMPVHYVNDNMLVDDQVVKQWQDNFPLNMIDANLPALKGLNALKLDWGRNEENRDIPVNCLQFSKKLEANRVKHFAEEYLGGHVNKQGGFDGRIFTDMLPFFNTYLKF
jgi:S-formylglutathione hydrolase FrmB